MSPFSTSAPRKSSAASAPAPGRGASSRSRTGSRSSVTRSTARSRCSTRRRCGSGPRSSASRRRVTRPYTRKHAPRVRHRLCGGGTRRARRRTRSRPPRAHVVPGPARHVSISPDGGTVWTVLGNASAHIAVLDTSRPAASEARPHDRAALPRPRRRVLPRWAHGLGHLGRGAADRALFARAPPATRARRGTSAAARRVRRAEGVRRERRRRHGPAAPARRRTRARGARPGRLVQRDVRLGSRRSRPRSPTGTLSVLGRDGRVRRRAQSRAGRPRRLHRLRPLKEAPDETVPRSPHHRSRRRGRHRSRRGQRLALFAGARLRLAGRRRSGPRRALRRLRDAQVDDGRRRSRARRTRPAQQGDRGVLRRSARRLRRNVGRPLGRRPSAHARLVRADSR